MPTDMTKVIQLATELYIWVLVRTSQLSHTMVIPGLKMVCHLKSDDTLTR